MQEVKTNKQDYNNYELEDLKLYHIYVDFMKYEYNAFEKFGMHTELKQAIEKQVLKGLECIIEYSKDRVTMEKLKRLNELDVALKVIKTYSRICKNEKIITSRNYKAVSGKINAINVVLLGCMKMCSKRLRTGVWGN